MAPRGPGSRRSRVSRFAAPAATALLCAGLLAGGISYLSDRGLDSASTEVSRIELASVRLDASRSLSEVQFALLDGGSAGRAATVWSTAQRDFVDRLDRIARRSPQLNREVAAVRAAVARSLSDSAAGETAEGVRFAGRSVGEVIAATAGDGALEGTSAVANAMAVDLIDLQRAMDVVVVAKGLEGDLSVVLSASGLPDNEALLVGSANLLRGDPAEFDALGRVSSLGVEDPTVVSAIGSLDESAALQLIESAVAWAIGVADGTAPSARAPSSFADILGSAETLAEGEMSLGSAAVASETERATEAVDSLEGRRTAFALAAAVLVVASIAAWYLAWQTARVKEDQLREAATTDPMTGIGNRGFLDEASARLRDDDGDLVLLHIDLDRFKPVNDTYGHAVGDSVLKAASGRLRTIAESSGGIVARLGGDEFAIAVPPASGPRIDALCAEVLEGLTVFEIEGLQLTVGASIGVARGATSIADLLLNSDLALYQAKRSGRGSASTFQAEAAEFVGFVRETLLAGNVHAAYQAQYSLQNGMCVGVEVLARLDDPVRGSIPAREWLGVAEWLGVTAELFEHVVGAVSRDLASGMRPQGRLWFNVSPNDMLRSGGVEWLLENLKRLGLPPRELGLELTETEAIEETSRLTAMVSDLRHVGLGVALDGFGARSSPIGHLVEIPVSRVKLDSSLIAGLGPHSGPSAWVVGAMANLARRLEIELVAEGVSSGEQLRALAQLGVPGAQGFLLCLPGPMNRSPGSVDLAMAAQTTLRSLEVDDEQPAPLSRQLSR